MYIELTCFESNAYQMRVAMTFLAIANDASKFTSFQFRHAMTVLLFCTMTMSQRLNILQHATRKSPQPFHSH